MNKAYIAGPFFNAKQINIIECIKTVCRRDEISFFSPKDESMFQQGDDPKVILDLNCKAIASSEFLIAITDDKDIGTMWEAGFAYSLGIPIIYVWLGYKPEMKFNIMLAASGQAVVHNYKSLHVQLMTYKHTGKFDSNLSRDMLHE